MTLTAPATDLSLGAPLTYDHVAFDLYRDIHKAIRAELFTVTHDAGRIDPADWAGRAAVAAHVDSVMTLLIEHADHEDGPIQPVLEAHLPDLAAQIERDHTTLEARIDGLRDQSASVVEGTGVGEDRPALHRLYVELASFTSAYLAHQDFEERVVMPALQTAVGIDAVVAIHGAIVGPMPPDEFARALALMLPAMNIDDREGFFVGFSAEAPIEVVDGVWNLAASVLDPADLNALAARIGR